MEINKKKEILNFAIAGVFGYLADALVTVFISHFVGVYFARIPGFLAASTVTWLFNRNITFGTVKSKHDSLFKEYLHYVSLMVIGLLINYIVYIIAVTVLPTSKYEIFISIALGSLAGMVFNYINSKKFIFNKK